MVCPALGKTRSYQIAQRPSRMCMANLLHGGVPGRKIAGVDHKLYAEGGAVPGRLIAFSEKP